LISKLTQWVICNAISQNQRWHKHGHQISVSINISANDVESLSLPEQMSTLLTEHSLEPSQLTLEVTETVLMGNQTTSLDILTRLRLRGINLSIDDFGTGHSSLTQLHKIPFNELKVDQGFVSKMVTDDEALAIVKTCITLGHELKMKVIAEGVENQPT